MTLLWSLACSDYDGVGAKEEDPGYTVGEGTGWRSVSVSQWTGCAVDAEGRLHGWGEGPSGGGAHCEVAPNGDRYAWVHEGRAGAIVINEAGHAAFVGWRSFEALEAHVRPGALSWLKAVDLLGVGIIYGTSYGSVTAVIQHRGRSLPLPWVPGTPATVTLGTAITSDPCFYWIDDTGAIRSECVEGDYVWPGDGRYVEVEGALDGLCALRDDATVECHTVIPFPDEPPLGLHDLTGFGSALCGIQEDGLPWCSHVSDPDDPITRPPPIRLHALTGTDGTACGLDEETHIVCWGDNRSGQRDPP